MRGRLLKERKAAILEGWMERILASYPQDSTRFLSRKGDPFGNPVGSTYQDHTNAIVEELCGEGAQAVIDAALLEIVKVRAVQQFSPSEALSFITALRGVARETLNEEELAEAGKSGELAGWDAEVERLLFKGIAQYAACRERMFEIRVKEIRAQTAKLVERMNSMGGDGFSD